MFSRFMDGVLALIKGDAIDKGYRHDPGEEDGGILLKFVNENFKGHPLGEVVYKAVRYSKRGNPDDLLKIAAWAYLEWRLVQAARVKVDKEGLAAPTHTRVDTCNDPFKAVHMGTAQTPLHTRYSTTKAPTEMPGLKEVRSVLDAVEMEIHRAYNKHPNVDRADHVRLAGLVCEEAGEAMKAALDLTRDGPHRESGSQAASVWAQMEVNMRTELVQTATMAVIAECELRRRRLVLAGQGWEG